MAENEITMNLGAVTAYGIAKKHGFTGTEQEWLDSLQGTHANLLRNWYFGNPVNQRGQTEYTGKIYGIDSWFSSNSGGTISVVDDCVNLSNSGSNSFIRQKMEQNLIAGCTYTFSVLVRGNIAGYFAVTQDDSAYSIVLNKSFSGDYQNWELNSFTFVANGTEKAVAIRNNAGFQLDVLAAKLEFGDHQTLAHQENGVWVLNEIPNYGEELLNCQRYYYRLSRNENSSASAVMNGTITNNSKDYVFLLPLPVQMRTNPAVSGNIYVGAIRLPSGDYSAWTGNTYVNTFNAVSANMNANLITLKFSLTTALDTVNNVPIFGQIDTAPGRYLELSADL